MFSLSPDGPGGPAPSPAEARPAAADDGLADGRPRRLDPRYVSCARLGGELFAGGLLLAVVLAFVFLVLGEELGRARLAYLGLLAALGVAAVALASWIHPPLKLRTSSWRLTPAGLEIRSGVCFRHLESVPRARVQHTDVERGPLERRFGLATLVVYTAGHQNSEIRLEGLEHGTAVAIRDHLLAGGGGRGA